MVWGVAPQRILNFLAFQKGSFYFGIVIKGVDKLDIEGIITIQIKTPNLEENNTFKEY